jgi:hypothetical protein
MGGLDHSVPPVLSADRVHRSHDSRPSPNFISACRGLSLRHCCLRSGSLSPAVWHRPSSMSVTTFQKYGRSNGHCRPRRRSRRLLVADHLRYGSGLARYQLELLHVPLRGRFGVIDPELHYRGETCPGDGRDGGNGPVHGNGPRATVMATTSVENAIPLKTRECS